MNRDRWDTAAMHRLHVHIMRETTRGKVYAPDTTYEMCKRGENGPHSMHIAGVLQRWADMWAQDMREASTRAQDGFDLSVDDKAQWIANMAEADGEIERYLSTFNLKLRSAA